MAWLGKAFEYVGGTYLVPVKTAIVNPFNLTQVITVFIKKVLIVVEACAWWTVTDLYNVLGAPSFK